MKKTASVIIILAAMSAFGHAQTASDAILFSSTDYEGTARTMAMGNAFTALGGDLGSISINPAGSAVAKYSQITLTPSLTLSISRTQGVSPYQDGSLPYFERNMKNTAVGFGLPNIGATCNLNTHRTSGLKNITFGFIANRSNSWNEDMYASGRNSTTSFMGAMAANATANGYLGSELDLDNAYDMYPWKDVVGYQSGMFMTYGGQDDQFAGTSEAIYMNGDNTEIALAGPIDQTFGKKVYGSKYEYLFNFGANFSDFLYIGANLGVNSMDYNYREYFKEAAVDPTDFEIELNDGKKMYFHDMLYKYSYSAASVGYFAKFGVILTPGAGLRIGAAISTPTLMNITEVWSNYGETNYTDKRYDAYASSPEGEYKYSFVAPYRANFGIGWSIGKVAVLSADYELCDYRKMRFKSPAYESSSSYFDEVNDDIKARFGTSHTFRFGAEVKPFRPLAIRAGYGVSTAAEKLDFYGEKLPNLYAHNVAFGLGFNSKGSFFADLACRYSFSTREGDAWRKAGEYIMPYEDYIFDTDGNLSAPAPEILHVKSAWKIMLTLGFRF